MNVFAEAEVKHSEVQGYEKIIANLRSLPNGDQIIQDNYLDEDWSAAFERFWQSAEWQNTVSILRPQSGEWVLDYGAGRCLSSAAFARCGCRVVALDINPSSSVGLGVLYQAALQPYAIVGVLGDAEHMMFPPATFDIVYCREALHHAYDLAKLTKNLVSVLKPGGRFYAYGEHRHPWWSSDQKFRVRHPAVQFGVNEHSYRESVYQHCLKNAGLHRIRIFPIIPVHDPLWDNAWHHRLMKPLRSVPGIGSVIYDLYTRLRLYQMTGSQIIISGCRQAYGMR
ncbi:MAG TPA: class I SAM-dependent methyltransferase [Anaerolineae bacterium]|nr:class I SAM-dependent methyltransferase [Anaerolineae bacterium]HQK15269.1 class I SAM-dependent methyltransferase [Anaerolineae bacterium]